MSLTADPPGCSIAAAGGNATHTLANAGAAKIVFKVKCSNNTDYKLKPVFGFVDAAGQAPLEITRTAGAPKEDKLVIQYGDAPEGATDAAEAIKTFGAAPPNTLTVPLSAA